MMYLLLTYRNARLWDALSGDERAEFANVCHANHEGLRLSGHLRVAGQLPSASTVPAVIRLPGRTRNSAIRPPTGRASATSRVPTNVPGAVTVYCTVPRVTGSVVGGLIRAESAKIELQSQSSGPVAP